MRLFISIPLPENIRKNLAEIRDDFSNFPAKWVEEENLHITLVFLGETDKTKVTEVTEAINIGMKGLNPINLETDGLSLLPDEKRPRILAIKLTGETEKLLELVEKIKKGLRERKVSFDEKAFRPHITFARLKRLRSGEKKNLKEKVHSYNLPEMKFKAERIELTESKLTPTGPVYKVLKHHVLC